MTSRNGEAGRVARPAPASELVAWSADGSEYSTPSRAVHKISRRLGCSFAVAAVVAQLAGLGPREVRR